MKYFILSALMLSSLNVFAGNPCAEGRDLAMKDLVKATAEVIVGNQVKSTDFTNEIIIETLGGSVVLSISGTVPTSDGDVKVLGSFECSELTTKYVLRGLTVSK